MKRDNATLSEQQLAHNLEVLNELEQQEKRLMQQLKESWNKEHQAKKEHDNLQRKKSTASIKQMNQSNTFANSRASLELTSYSNRSNEKSTTQNASRAKLLPDSKWDRLATPKERVNVKLMFKQQEKAAEGHIKKQKDRQNAAEVAFEKARTHVLQQNIRPKTDMRMAPPQLTPNLTKMTLNQLTDKVSPKIK